MTDDLFKLAMGLIPPEQKQAYDEAMEKAPGLVATESNPIFFLEACNYEAHVAAQKLAQYWTIRKRVFGDEEAFLPMTLPSASSSSSSSPSSSDRSAISGGVFDIIKRGVLVQLPDDEAGRPVLCFDTSRLGIWNGRDPHVHSQRMANLFYNIHKIATGENARARTDGIVIVRIVTADAFDPVKFKQSFGMVTHCMPMKIFKIQYCCTANTLGEQRQVAMALTPMLVERLEQSLPGNMSVHVGGSSTLLKALQQEGLKEDSLPPKFGGTWSYESFERQIGVTQNASTSNDSRPDQCDSTTNTGKRQREEVDNKSQLLLQNWMLRLMIAKLLKQLVLKLLKDVVERNSCKKRRIESSGN